MTQPLKPRGETAIEEMESRVDELAETLEGIVDEIASAMSTLEDQSNELSNVQETVTVLQDLIAEMKKKGITSR